MGVTAYRREEVAALKAATILTPGAGFPLKAGFELYIGAAGDGGCQENLKMQFRFDVGLRVKRA
jgi:hypothetical protein